MRIAFFGSPAFALPSLQALAERFEIGLVVTQPDKPAGRGMVATPPPVARFAREAGLPLSQPTRLKGNHAFHEELKSVAPQVAVTVAYGRLLPQSLLDLPPSGFLNVHGSLLPSYRGAGPVQWALINGERETGVSIMRTELGLDTGPVCLQRRLAIDEEERAPELFERLSTLGAQAIVEALELLQRNELDCLPQDDSRATFAPLLEREDGDIDWNQSARRIFDRFRGVYLWPGSRFSHDGKEIRVTDMGVTAGRGEPGEVLAVTRRGVTVAAGEGAVELREVQPAGRGRQPAADWANGYRVSPGVRLA